MRILGIDPGIADTGWGVIENNKGKLKCLAYGSIKTSSKKELPERLVELNQELNNIIKEYKPKIVGVEELFFCKNVKTALTVGHARGVILLTLKQNKLNPHEYTPLQIKQAVTSYGKADKGQVQGMVKVMLNLKEIPKPDDAADALAVAICTANSTSRNP
jgi:crossover junction endodeoxyribonuclease RuvC